MKHVTETFLTKLETKLSLNEGIASVQYTTAIIGKKSMEKWEML